MRSISKILKSLSSAGEDDAQTEMTDAELKDGMEAIFSELVARGWDVDCSSGKNGNKVYVRKRIML